MISKFLNRKKNRKTVIPLLFSFLFTILLLGMLELFARGRPESGWVVYWTHPTMDILMPYPDQHIIQTAYYYPFRVDIDSNGFRFMDRTSKVPKNDDAIKVRVLVLGDSFTFGDAVNNEFTYPQFLQSRLGQNPGFIPEVFNGANIWMTIAEQLAVYKFLNTKHQFDIVVLQYYGANDIYELSTISSRKSTMNSPVFSYLMSKSAFLRFFAQKIFFTYGVGRATEIVNVANQNYESDYQALEALYAEKFGELVTKVQKNNQMLVILPVLGRNSDGSAKSDKLITQLAQQYQIDILAPEYKEEHYLKYDPHFSPVGNYYVATLLEDYILNQWDLEQYTN